MADDTSDLLDQLLNSDSTNPIPRGDISQTAGSAGQTDNNKLDPGGFSSGPGTGAAGVPKPPSATPPSPVAPPKPDPNLFSTDPAIQDILTQIINGQVPDYAAYNALSQFDQPQNPSWAGFNPRPANAVRATGPLVEKLYNEGAANYFANTGNVSGDGSQVYFADQDPTIIPRGMVFDDQGNLVPGGLPGPMFDNQGNSTAVPNPDYRAVTPQQQAELDDLARTYPSQLDGSSFTGLDALELFGPVIAAPLTAGASEAIAGAAEGADAASVGADAADFATSADVGLVPGSVGAASTFGTDAAAGAEFAGADFAAGEAGTESAPAMAFEPAPAVAEPAPDLSGFTGTAGDPFGSMSGTAFSPTSDTFSAAEAPEDVAGGDMTSSPFEASPDYTGPFDAGPDATQMPMSDATLTPDQYSPPDLTGGDSGFNYDPTQGPPPVKPDVPMSVTDKVLDYLEASPGKLGSYVAEHPIGSLATAGSLYGVGNQLINGNKKSSAEKQLERNAANASAIGTSLIQQGQAGTLSPGVQAQVDLLRQQMQAKVRGTYANLGLSGSTMEADAMNNIETQISAVTQQYSSQLITIGQQILNSGTTGYQSIAEAEASADANLQAAIKNFAVSAGLAQANNKGNS